MLKPVSHHATHHAHHYAFASGASKPVSLGGVAGTERAPSAHTGALLKKLTLHPDWPFFASDFKLPKASLSGLTSATDFANAVLFKAVKPFDASQYASYYTKGGLTVTPLQPKDLDKALLATLSASDAFTGEGAADKAKVAKDLAALKASMAGAGFTRAVQLDWSNHDDASFHAVALYNANTGEVRVAGWYPQP